MFLILAAIITLFHKSITLFYILFIFWILTSLPVFYLVRKLIHGKFKKIFRQMDPSIYKQAFAPFIRYQFKQWNLNKIYRNCFILFPLKFFLMIDVLTCAVFLIYCITTIQRFLKYRSQKLRSIMTLYAHTYALFVMRIICTVQQIQINKPQEQQQPIFISNHITWFQATYYVIRFWPVSALMVDDIAKFPLVGYILKYLDCLFMARQDRNSRQFMLNKMTQRMELNKKIRQPPLLIFPQGTTVNGTTLIRFKKGAFQPLAKIRILGIKYQVDRFNPTLDDIGFGMAIIFMFLHSCSAKLFIKYGISASNDNVQDYIRNTQKQMCELLNMKMSDARVRDKLQYIKLQKL